MSTNTMAGRLDLILDARHGIGIAPIFVWSSLSTDHASLCRPMFNTYAYLLPSLICQNYPNAVQKLAYVFKNLPTNYAVHDYRDKLPLAADIMRHPAYPTALWQLEADKQATVVVGQDRRGGPTKIYYEIHGRGPIHVLVRTASLSLFPFPFRTPLLTFHRSSAASRLATRRGNDRRFTLATCGGTSTRSCSLTTAALAGPTSPTP